MNGKPIVVVAWDTRQVDHQGAEGSGKEEGRGYLARGLSITPTQGLGRVRRPKHICWYLGPKISLSIKGFHSQITLVNTDNYILAIGYMLAFQRLCRIEIALTWFNIVFFEHI